MGQGVRAASISCSPIRPYGGREEDGIENNFPTFRTKETADLFLALIVRLLKQDGRAAVVLPDGTLFGEGVKTRLKEHLMEECNLHTIVRLLQFLVFKPYASDRHQPAVLREGDAPTKDIWFYMSTACPEGQKSLFDDQADLTGALSGLH